MKIKAPDKVFTSNPYDPEGGTTIWIILQMRKLTFRGLFVPVLSHSSQGILITKNPKVPKLLHLQVTVFSRGFQCA